MAFRFSEVVGRFALVVTSDLLDFIERTFVAPLSEPERAPARQAAHDEASGATLEIGGDGVVVSRSGPDVLYRSQLVVADHAYDELVLEKPGGERVTLRLLDPDTLEAVQTGRPALTFKRVAAPA